MHDVNNMWPVGLCQVLSSQLSMEAMSFVTEDRKTAQESTFPNTHTFDLFGGVDVSLTLMLRYHWTVFTTEESGMCGAPCTVLAHSNDFFF